MPSPRNQWLVGVRVDGVGPHLAIAPRQAGRDQAGHGQVEQRVFSRYRPMDADQKRVGGPAPAPPVEPGHQLDPALGDGADDTLDTRWHNYRTRSDWVRDAPAAKASARPA